MSESPKSGPESFESSLRKLEDIVAKMESGALTLDQMLKAFEEGSRLVKVCNTRLDEVEHRIELLVKKDGKLEGKPLPEAPSNEESP